MAQLGKRAEALDACEQAARLGAGGEVLFAKALLHAQLGKADEAISTLQSMLRVFPTHQRALLALSSLLADTGELPRALGHANAARETCEAEYERAVATQQIGLLRLRIGLDNASLPDLVAAKAELERAVHAR